MWVNLTKEEIAKIMRATGSRTLHDKLTQNQHPDADLFRNGANVDAYLHVAPNAPVKRTRNGAYVLAWRWVYNEDVGFMGLTDFDEFSVADETLAKLEALREFQLDYVRAGHHVLGEGAIDRHRWRLGYRLGTLQFSISTNDARQELLWSQSRPHRRPVGTEAALLFICEATNNYRVDFPVIGPNVKMRFGTNVQSECYRRYYAELLDE